MAKLGEGNGKKLINNENTKEMDKDYNFLTNRELGKDLLKINHKN